MEKGAKANTRDATINMDLNHVSSRIIRSAIDVHRELGPGLLESVYQSCMLIDLRKAGIRVESEVALPVYYLGHKIDEQGFRLDLWLKKLKLELKSVEKVQPVHKKQLLTYLRLAKKPLGLLINFNEELLVNGITRIVNN